MAIFGRTDVLPKEYRQDLEEITGVRGFGGDFERHFYVKAPADGPQAVDEPSPQDLFLDTVQFQHRLTEKGAKHWVPIVTFGRGKAGAFAVLDHYAGTLEQTLESKLRFDATTLHHVVTRILAGLKEIRRLADRPHGNLSARNVLLTDPRAPRTGAIVLTDPAPASRATARDDVEDLGRIIHLLVLGRPFGKLWPVPLTPDWSGLGRTGKGWLKLCNRMLHPQPERRITLRKAASAVAALGRRRRPWVFRPELVAAAAAVVGLGLYGWNWYQSRPPHTPTVAVVSNPTTPSVTPTPPVAVEAPRKLVTNYQPPADPIAPLPPAPRADITVPEPAVIASRDGVTGGSPFAVAFQPIPVTPTAPPPIHLSTTTRPTLSPPVVAVRDPEPEVPDVRIAFAGLRDLLRPALATGAGRLASLDRHMSRSLSAHAAATQQKWLADLIAATRFEHPRVRAHWQLRGRLPKTIDEAARLAPDDRRSIETQIVQLQAIEKSAKSLPEPPPFQLAGAPWAEDLTKTLRAAADQQRDAAVDAMIAGTSPDDARAAYTASVDRLVGLMRDVQAADRQLREGFAPDESPAADAPAAATLLDRALAAEGLDRAAFHRALSPLRDPLALPGDAPALLQRTAADTRPLGVRLAAWRSLEKLKDWPADQPSLNAAVSAAEKLIASINKLDDAQRRATLEREVVDATNRHWARVLESAPTADAIAALVKLRDDVTPDELKSLSPRTRANVLLYRMQQEISPDAAAQLRQALTELPAGRNPAPLTQLLQQVESNDAGFDPAAAGPASRDAKAANRIEWKYAHDAAGGTIRFTATVSPDITREPIELVFKRVDPADGSTAPFYLCTTEVSTGLFSDVTTAGDRWTTMSRLLWQYSPRQPDPRTGPRTWEWPRYGRPTLGFRRTIVWLESAGDHYPPELSTPENRTVLRDPDGRPSRDLNPSRHAPIQYVSPDAVIYFASLLGCRLPTPAEWRAALRQDSTAQQTVRVKPNLRDRTWRAQYQWATASAARTALSPGLGMFRPADEKLTDAIWQSDPLAGGAAAADSENSGEPYDDGVLWFSDVHQATVDGPAASFSHLIGNVAEYVVDHGRVYVIGASALSPPPQIRPVDKAVEVPAWQTSPGYSDVGFRLAFPAPTGPIERLRLALKDQKFLTP